MNKTLPLSLTLLALVACSHSPNSPTLELNTSKNLETVVLMGTNDIHGALLPLKLKTREPEGTPAVEYQAGGTTLLGSYVRVLQAKYGSNFLWLDGGDEFQGTLESNSQKGAPMVEFFNRFGLGAAAVGNHEFDFGASTDPGDLRGSLKDRIREAHYPYLAANILDLATLNHNAIPNTIPHKIFQVGKIKVGVLGLSTLDTPTTTRAQYVADLKFEDLKDATLREASVLRSEGADVVVITSHVGISCGRGKALSSHAILKETDPLGDCDPDDEMVRLLRSIPKGTVDAVISGHSHTVVHHWVSGTPVIQAGSSGRYFNLITLTYDLEQKRVITDQTRIEGPVPVCAMVFENQGDCNGDRPAPPNGRGKLISFKFKGTRIKENDEALSIVQPIVAKTDEIKKELIATAARAVDHTRKAESALGNVAADSLRKSIRADFGLMNAGGIRAPFEAGPITYGDVFRTFPFDNAVAKLTLSGKEVKELFRIAESGSRGFFPFSGLRARVIDLDFDAPSTDLNQDGKIDPWEVNRLLSLKTSDGKEIADAKQYTVATIDFLVTGGDDLGWFMNRIPKERKVLAAGPLARDAVVTELRELAKSGPVNALDRPLVDPKAPRLELRKSDQGDKPVRRRGKRKRHR